MSEASPQGLPKISCPLCGAPQEDYDGLGVAACHCCGYCAHYSYTGGVCDTCGAKEEASSA